MEFAFAPDKYSAAVVNLTTNALIFEFKAVKNDDVGLAKMASYLNTGVQTSQGSENPICPWYKQNDIKKYLTLKLSQFSSFAKANADDEDLSFIVADTSENQTPSDKAVALVSYVMGQCDQKDFEPPSPPGLPQVSNVTHDSIDLVWEKPQCTSDLYVSYKVTYTTKQGQLKSLIVSGEKITVNDLKPNSYYTFKVQAVGNIGVSIESESVELKTAELPTPITSNVIHTNAPVSSEPGQPDIVNMTDTLIELKWSKPQTHPESVTSYEVFCCRVDDNHIVHKQTNGVVETLIIDELKPETKYSFTVKAICDAGLSCESQSSEIIVTKAPLSSEPGQPDIVNVTDTLIELKWSKPQTHPESVTSYEVFCCRVDDNHIVHKQTNGVVETQIIDELKPETKYSFTVKAICDAGLSCESQSSEIIVTKAPLSSEPGQPDIVNVTDTLIELKWSKPQTHPESVTSYEVFCCRVDDNHIVHKQTNGVVETQIIDELKPETKYSFTVKAICDAGLSCESQTSAIIVTKAPLSSEPRQPDIVNVTDTLIELKWSKPQTHPESVTSYEVFCCRVDDNHIVHKQTNGVVETQIIDELTPETKYNFTVKAICNAGLSCESQSSEIIVTKAPLSSEPGQPDIVNVTDTLIELKWSKPQTHPESVTSYEVFCCRVDDNHIVHKQTNGVVETQIIDELKPETKYSFTVKAICDAGLSCESQTSAIIVTKAPLSSEPGQPDIVNVTDTLIELKWSKPQTHPESVTSYEVFCCRVDDNHIVHKQTNGVVETQIIDELTPETKYNFTVKAICNAGLSCESQSSEIIVTKAPLSSEPGQPDIVNVTDTLIELKWSKPQTHPESVTSYEVFCCRVDDNHIVHKQTNGVVETQIIDELKPETKYSFTVKAICDAGLSCESQSSEIIVTKAPLSSEPGQPDIVNVTDTLIELKWSKPQTHPESVTSYEVFCCRVDDNHIVHKQTNGVVETLIIDELKPETKYSFTVKAICDAGLSCESQTSEIIVTKAPLSSEPGQPDIVNVTDTLIELKWSKPQTHPESVTSYEVFCCRVDDNHIVHKQTNGVVETQIIDELTPETKYNFTVKAICNAGLSCESQSSEIIVTKAPLSSEPGQPDIVNVTDTLIELKWSKPQTHPESVTSYEVFCCRVDDNHIVHKQTNGVVETQIIDELKPETKYSFTVKAICDAGLSCESQSSEIIVTKAPLSSEPGQPDIVNVTDTLIELKWSKPQTHPESVTSYEVFCCRVDDNHIVHKQTNGVVETQIIDELKPETKYSFTVKAICDAGLSCESQSSDIIVTKAPLSSEPGQPDIVNMTDTLIELKWSKPQTHPESVTSYEVFCCRVDDNHIVHKQTNGVVETLIIDELKPETKYSFTVKAICNAGLSCESQSSEIIVTKAPLSSEPGQPDIVNVTDTLIELKWSKPQTHPESVTSYEVFCCRVDDNHIVHKQTNGVVETQIIDELKPETKYSFTVKAICDAGLSCESQSSEIIVTKAPLSSEPGQPDIVNVTDTLIELKWSKPQTHPESVTSYEVFCCRVDDNHIVHKQTNGVVETQIIDELKPETKYSFTVKAICDAGLSCESQSSEIIVTKAPLSSEPGQPDIVNVTDTLIELKWSKPQTHPESVTSYEVFCCRVDDNHIVHKQTNGVVETQIIDELKPETKYSFTVKAICDAGLSCESQSSEIIVTKAPLSSEPGQPDIVNVTDTLIELKWSKPQTHPESVTSYEVFCCRVDDNHIVHKQTNGVVETLIIDELKPETKYSFTVKAICDAGLSCESQTSEIIVTKAPLSSEPGQPDIVNVTDTLIELKWSKPQTHPESVTSYEVFCCRVDDNHIVHKQTNGVVETLIIDELKPETKYSFTVKAICDARLSCESQTSEIIVTKAPLSSEPGQPDIVNVTDTLIELKWSKPQTHPESVTSYEVFCCRVDDNHIVHKQTNGVVETQIIDELKPETKYSFTVKAICDAGLSCESQSSEIIVTKAPLSSEPGQPDIVNVTDTLIELKWSKPQTHPESVTSYEVFCCRVDDNHIVHKQTNGVVETQIIDELKPETKYSFTVKAICDAGLSCESQSSEIIVTKAPLSSEPGQPDIVNVTDTLIELKWSKPQTHPESVTSYEVFCCRVDDNHIVHKQTNGVVETQIIDELKPETKYSFTVKAICDAGLSCESQSSEIIVTKAPLSSEPGQPDIVNVTDTLIELKWSKPQTHPESVTSYEVFCCRVDDNHIVHKQTNGVVETLIIDELKPETKYSFTVKAICDAGLSCESQSSEIIVTKAPLSSEPGQPDIVNVTDTLIELKWSKPQTHPESVTSYEVFCCRVDDNHIVHKQTNGVVETLIIDELKLETKYSFTVKAICDAGDSAMSAESKIIKTEPPLSSEPGTPFPINISHNSVELEWTKPEKHASSVLFYTVYCHCLDEQSDMWKPYDTDNIKERMLIDGLKPKGNYRFKVQATCRAGKSAESEKTGVISTKLPVSGSPGIPSCCSVSSNTIEVKWSKPDKNPEYVQKYKVLYKPENDRTSNWMFKLTKGKEKHITLEKLLSNTSYLFKVQAECNDELSEESEVSESVKTMLPLPRAPGQPSASHASHDSIKLRWRKDWSDSHIKNYKISYKSRSDLTITNTWNTYDTEDAEENAVIQNLLPKTTYVFKVQAQTLDGQFSTESKEYEIMTKPIIPGPPGRPNVDVISEDSVRLQWTKPDKHTEVIQRYVVCYCSLNVSDKQWQYYQDGSLKEENLVKGLLPDSKYCFTIQAECEDGLSEKSAISPVIKTLIPIPSQPGQPKRLSVTEKSVTLQWAKPAQYAKYVEKYSVDFHSQNDMLYKWKTVQVARVQENTTIIDLFPKTSYIFRVQAHNSTGSSEKSEVSEIISTDAALPSQPGQPRAIKVTHDQITLTWAKPECYTNQVQNYIILYFFEGRQIKVKTKSTEQVFTVSQLSPNTSYHFKVQAESEDGVSKDSDISDVIKTRSPIPSQPGKPKCDSAEHDCITLSWSKPDHYYENVQYYEVSYYPDDIHRFWPWNDARKTEGPVEKIVVDGLNPKKSYYFKVRAKSKFGDGPESVTSDVIGTKPFRLAINIVSQCTKINDSPVVYQVPMKEVARTDEQKLAKYEFGKIPRFTTHKVLMVVGATGAGKTTLINGMINYLFGVEWKDEFRFKLINEVVQSETKSVTKWITAYSFPKQNGFKFQHSLTIVDTPGFGDTEGIRRDQEITCQIKEFFSTSGPNGIDHLDGIGFVANATLGRLTPTQRYIFNSILSVFGNDVKDNIFIMTTFADGAKPPVIGAIDEAEIPYKEKFKFNNSALYAPPSTEKVDEMFWDMGAVSFNEFFDHFTQVKSVSIKLSQEVLTQREQLETIIVGLQKQIQAGMSKIDELKQTKKILEDNKANIEANKDFTYVVEEAQIKEIVLQTGQYVTNCLKCNFTCHFPCRISDDGEKYRCAAMKNKKDKHTTCEICPGKCAWQQHRNMPYRLEIEKVAVTKHYNDLKERYDKAVEGKTQQESIIANIEKDIQNIFNIILQNIQKAHRCTERLDEIALKPNPLTDVEYIDLLIESEKQERKAGYRERIAYYEEVSTRAELIRKARGQLPQELSAEEAESWWKTMLSVKPSEEIPVQLPMEIIPTTQPTVDAPLEENDTQQSWKVVKAVKSGIKWFRGK